VAKKQASLVSENGQIYEYDEFMNECCPNFFYEKLRFVLKLKVIVLYQIAVVCRFKMAD